MTIPPFSIPAVLGGSADDGEEFDVDIPVTDLEADDPALVANVRFHVRFVRQGKELQVEVEGLSTLVRGECSRCATPCEIPVAFDHVTAFVPIDGFDEDYPIRLDLKKGQADLSDWLRVEILSVLEPFTLCREGCLGCCPHCGRNLNQASCGCAVEEDTNPFKELEKHFKK